MIGALCESPLTFEALTVWRDELNEGKVLLRDIIDLEAMYGAGPDGQPAPVVDGIANGLVPPQAAMMNGHDEAAAAPQSPLPRRRNQEARAGARARTTAMRANAKLAAAEAAAEADDFDDEGNLPLSAMEAALKPQVLETLDQIAVALQEAGQAAGRLRRSGAGVRRTLHRPGTPLQEAAQRDRRSRQRPQAQQQPHRSAGRPDVRHQSPAGLARRQAAAAGRSPWRRPRSISSSSISATSSIPIGRAGWGGSRALGWKDFVQEERDRVKQYRDEIQTLAQEMRQSIVEFRRIVQTVQKGERECGAGQEGNDRGQSAPRHLHRQEIHQSRPAIPRPDPGRQYRPDEGGR